MMNKLSLLLVLFLVQTITTAQNTRSNCGASPYPVTILQNDGSSITYKVLGNEQLHYFETEDGYTILPNQQGVFEYAKINTNGELVPGGVKAHSAMPNSLNKNNVVKHLRYSASQIEKIKSDFNQQNQHEIALFKAAGEFPSTGNNKLCVLLVDFSDDQSPYPLQNFQNLMNQNRYQNTGSFKDAYLEYSNNQFSPNSDVYGWFRASLPRASYAQTNTDGTPNSQYMTRVRQLVTEAINKADSAGVDFSQYDNDNDGDVDGLIIFQAGFGAEQGLNGYIWSHRSTISTVVKDGKSIRNYCINPAKRNWSGQTGMVGIGVVSHEFGHIIGLPDLYDTDNSSEAIGNWGLMGGGPWLNQERTPCHLSPWSKMQMGWLNPITINSTGTYTLINSVDSNMVYRVNTPNVNEYFLLENKQKKKFDTYVPGRGLIIWHINTTKTSLYPGSNTVNRDSASYGVGVKQADGLRELERNIDRGDAGDPFPGTTNNRNFTPFSIPSSDLHPNAQGVRNPSNVSVTSITQNNDSTITFNLGNKAVSAFSLSSVSGCAPLTISFNNVSAFATNFSWNFGNGETSNQANPSNVTYTKAGNYTIKLYALDSLNQPIDSSEQTVNVKAGPTAKMTIERGDSNSFQLNNLSTDAAYVVWRFGSNQTSTAPNPKITLTTPGNLDVKLIAYTLEQCTDTAFETLSFWPLGLAENNIFGEVNAWPNPFSNALNLSIELKQNTNAEIKITDVLGKHVDTIFKGNLSAGINGFAYSNALPQGMYFITISTPESTRVIKVTSAH